MRTDYYETETGLHRHTWGTARPKKPFLVPSVGGKYYHANGTWETCWHDGRFSHFLKHAVCGNYLTRGQLSDEAPDHLKPCPGCFDVSITPKAAA